MYCEWTLENDTVNKTMADAPKGLYWQKRLIENLITPTDAPKGLFRQMRPIENVTILAAAPK